MFNQPLSFDTSNLTETGYMFKVRSARALAPSLESNPPRACRLRRRRAHALPSPGPYLAPHRMPSFRLQGVYKFNHPLSFDTSSVTGMRNMFDVRSARTIGPHSL